jgi:hypothetical protein
MTSLFLSAEKRREGGLRLGRLQPVTEVIGFLVDARDDVVLARAAHQPARRQHRFRRQRRNLPRGIHRQRIDVARRGDRIDETGVFRSLRIERLPHRQQREGAAVPHQARGEEARRRLRHEPRLTNGVENLASVPQTA